MSFWCEDFKRTFPYDFTTTTNNNDDNTITTTTYQCLYFSLYMQQNKKITSRMVNGQYHFRCHFWMILYVINVQIKRQVQRKILGHPIPYYTSFPYLGFFKSRVALETLLCSEVVQSIPSYQDSAAHAHLILPHV